MEITSSEGQAFLREPCSGASVSRDGPVAVLMSRDPLVALSPHTASHMKRAHFMLGVCDAERALRCEAALRWCDSSGAVYSIIMSVQ